MTLFAPVPWPRLDKSSQVIQDQAASEMLVLPVVAISRDTAAATTKQELVRCNIPFSAIAQRLGVRNKVWVGLVPTPRASVTWDEVQAWPGFPLIKVWNTRKRQWTRANVRGHSGKAAILEMCHASEQQAIRISAVQEQVGSALHFW